MKDKIKDNKVYYSADDILKIIKKAKEDERKRIINILKLINVNLITEQWELLKFVEDRLRGEK